MNNLNTIVETAVNDKVKNGEMFTAYDITLEIRKQGHKTLHAPVRDAVHDFYNRGGLGIDYTRTVIQVPNSNGSPYLYHRGADDPSTYNNFNNNSYIAIPTSNVSPNPVSTSKRLKLGQSKFKTVDSRGHLNIPAPIIRAAGFKNAQKVYAVANADEIVVLADEPDASDLFEQYTVDEYLNVRIGKMFLQKAGIPGSKYDIEYLNGKLSVKSAN